MHVLFVKKMSKKLLIQGGKYSKELEDRSSKCMLEAAYVTSGQWQVIKKLGRGSNGTCYMCCDVNSKFIFCVKEVKVKKNCTSKSH